MGKPTIERSTVRVDPRYHETDTEGREAEAFPAQSVAGPDVFTGLDEAPGLVSNTGSIPSGVFWEQAAARDLVSRAKKDTGKGPVDFQVLERAVLLLEEGDLGSQVRAAEALSYLHRSASSLGVDPETAAEPMAVLAKSPQIPIRTLGLLRFAEAKIWSLVKDPFTPRAVRLSLAESWLKLDMQSEKRVADLCDMMVGGESEIVRFAFKALRQFDFKRLSDVEREYVSRAVTDVALNAESSESRVLAMENAHLYVYRAQFVSIGEKSLSEPAEREAFFASWEESGFVDGYATYMTSDKPRFRPRISLDTRRSLGDLAFQALHVEDAGFRMRMLKVFEANALLRDLRIQEVDNMYETFAFLFQMAEAALERKDNGFVAAVLGFVNGQSFGCWDASAPKSADYRRVLSRALNSGDRALEIEAALAIFESEPLILRPPLFDVQYHVLRVTALARIHAHFSSSRGETRSRIIPYLPPEMVRAEALVEAQSSDSETRREGIRARLQIATKEDLPFQEKVFYEESDGDLRWEAFVSLVQRIDEESVEDVSRAVDYFSEVLLSKDEAMLEKMSLYWDVPYRWEEPRRFRGDASRLERYAFDLLEALSWSSNTSVKLEILPVVDACVSFSYSDPKLERARQNRIHQDMLPQLIRLAARESDPVLKSGLDGLFASISDQMASVNQDLF